MVELLEQARHCPVCDNVPYPTVDDVLGQKRVFLRCPKAHPYVACGDNLVGALINWNEYIQMRMKADTEQMIKTITEHPNSSFCRHCQGFTRSIMQINKVYDVSLHLGYSTNKEQCADCHLIKSQKDVA